MAGADSVTAALSYSLVLPSPAGSLPIRHSTAVNCQSHSTVKSPRGADASIGSFPITQSTVNTSMEGASNGSQAATSSSSKLLQEASPLEPLPIQKSREVVVPPSLGTAALTPFGHVEVAGLGPSDPTLVATTACPYSVASLEPTAPSKADRLAALPAAGQLSNLIPAALHVQSSAVEEVQGGQLSSEVGPSLTAAGQSAAQNTGTAASTVCSTVPCTHPAQVLSAAHNSTLISAAANVGIPNSSAPTVSFLHALRPNLNTRPTYIIPDVQMEEEPSQPQENFNDITVAFSKSEMASIEARFQFTFVMKFPKGCPKLFRVQENISKWGLGQPFSVVPMDPRHVVLHLTSAEDFSRVWTIGPRVIDSASFKLLKWSSDFNTKEEPAMAAVWVGFPNPHLLSFIPGALKRMANSFGKFLTMAEETRSFSTATVAKACVEVDLSKPLPTFLKIAMGDRGVYTQSIKYFSNIKCCCHCKIQGHSIRDCFRAHPELKKAPTSVPQATKTAPIHTRFDDSSEQSSPEGRGSPPAIESNIEAAVPVSNNFVALEDEGEEVEEDDDEEEEAAVAAAELEVEEEEEDVEVEEDEEEASVVRQKVSSPAAASSLPSDVMAAIEETPPF